MKDNDKVAAIQGLLTATEASFQALGVPTYICAAVVESPDEAMLSMAIQASGDAANFISLCAAAVIEALKALPAPLQEEVVDAFTELLHAKVKALRKDGDGFKEQLTTSPKSD